MNLEQVQKLIDAGDIETLIAAFRTSVVVKGVAEALAQYDPTKHKIITDRARRKDYDIKNKDGTLKSQVERVRLSLAYQKKIVRTHSAFLGSPKMESTPKEGKEADLVTILQKIHDDNKLDYKFRKKAKYVYSEKQVAELWFTKPAEEGYWDGYPFESNLKFSMKLLAFSLGDELLPVFDEFGDMVAFGRVYKITGDDGKEINYFDLLTAEWFYYWKQVDGKWVSDLKDSDTFKVKNLIGKIPIVYYYEPLTIWEDVQWLIEILEVIISDHRETNGRIGFPIVFLEGDVQGFPEWDDTGKVLISKSGGKASYLTWNAAPESLKLEIENLVKFIHFLTNTPDTSLEKLQGLGYFSTVALQTIFLDVHLRASESEETFGEGEQRKINLLKAAIAKLDTSYKEAIRLPVKPKFEYFLPKDAEGIITTLNAAVAGKIMTAETAVKQNPLVKNPDEEIEKLKKEADEAAKLVPVPVNGKPTNGKPVPVNQQ